MKFSDKTDMELAAIVRLGGEAKMFLANEFYVNNVKPELDKEKDAVVANSEWRPGNPTELKDIAVPCVYNSGLKVGLKRIEFVIGRFIQDSIEANKEITYRLEKKNK